MTTSTIIIAVLVVAVLAEFYLLKLASKRITGWRKQNMKLRNELRVIKGEAKFEREYSRTMTNRFNEMKAKVTALEAELSEYKKREERRKERELRKSIQRQNDAIKQAEQEAKERKAKHPRRKIRPLHGAVHNPKKK